MIVEYDYAFYAVNKENQLVYGFDNEFDAKEYAKKHKLKIFSREAIKRKNIDASNWDSWSDKFPDPDKE